MSSMALLQAEAAAEWHIADVGHPAFGQRREPVHMMIGADALDGAHGPGAEPGAGRLVTPRSIGTPIEGDVEAAEVRNLRAPRPQRRIEEGRYTFIGLWPAVRAGKDLVHDLAELGVV